MSIIPIEKMRERTKMAKQDSDTSYFLSLLYFGEMLTKLTCAGLVSAIDNDRERNNYRIMHRLVRADGLGEWSSSIEDILSGPSSRSLDIATSNEQQELNSRCDKESWQYESIKWLNKCIKIAKPEYDRLPVKIQGRRWFADFVYLRNITRGHGALLTNVCSQMCFPLEESIDIFIENFILFKRPWFFLHKNLSGKYRGVNLSKIISDKKLEEILNKIDDLDDGIYIKFNKIRRTEMVYSSVDGIDFFFPNGGFSEKNFKTISYITSNTGEVDSTPYLAPTLSLPESETQGIGCLDVKGNCFTNLPSLQKGYVARQDLEEQLKEVIIDDRHRIVTLIGRGGIGKTSLALKVLTEICETDRFPLILWFSARDIDLFNEGPKTVSPHILNIEDISNEYVRLIEPSQKNEHGFSAQDYFSKALRKNEYGYALYVFDNFETIKRPIELYKWLDTYINSPNKILITTRLRNFKGDFPIEVFGMDKNQSRELICGYSKYLGINHLITNNYESDLIKESEGHPYVIKILLGEVAKKGSLLDVERIIATKDEILNALFERTYNGLSSDARRIFLTLCNWRSIIPLIGLEAVLLRPSNERMDVEAAVEELRLCSFVEVHESPEDETIFLNVPLVASIFGKRKLTTSTLKSSIEADNQLLYAFGASQTIEISRGIAPKIENLIKHVAKNISQNNTSLEDYIPMLEFLARRYPDTWLLIARLYEELNLADYMERSKEAIRRFLESTPKEYVKQGKAWNDLSNLYNYSKDFLGEINALVEMCKLSDAPFEVISNSVNRVNALFYNRSFIIDNEEKKIISQTLAEIMNKKITLGDATDCSRLAWLYLRIQDRAKAIQVVERGLILDKQNDYCINLYKRLKQEK